jgi:WD40 repeat protein
VLCAAVAGDGGSVLSGWDDGRVRCFRPQSGGLAWVLHDAHEGGVSALAVDDAGRRLVTGGRDGRVRVWAVSGPTRTLEHTFKEHRGAVTCVALAPGGEEAVSASADGSCVVWSLAAGTRARAFFASTQFRGVRYAEGGRDLVTVGSDRRVAVWRARDAVLERAWEGAEAEVSVGGCGGALPEWHAAQRPSSLPFSHTLLEPLRR